MPAKILFVTGASSFLGGHFLRIGARAGWHLRCLTRCARGRLNSKKIRWVEGDLLEEGRWMEALDGCSTVVHLATLPMMDCETRAREARRVIVGGLDRLLQAGLERGVKRWILASTCEVYGIQKLLPIHEAALPKPLSVYGNMKATAEAHAISHAQRHDLSVCILRFFNLYGSGVDGAIPISVARLFAEPILKGQKVLLHCSYRNSRDFLHVSDAARAISLAVKRDAAEGVFNIANGREVPLIELARRIARLAGRRLRLDFRPEEGRMRRGWADIRRARSVLGYSPKVSLDQGLAEMLARQVSNQSMGAVGGGRTRRNAVCPARL